MAKINEEKIAHIVFDYEQDILSISEIAEKHKVSIRTVMNYARRFATKMRGGSAIDIKKVLKIKNGISKKLQ